MLNLQAVRAEVDEYHGSTFEPRRGIDLAIQMAEAMPFALELIEQLGEAVLAWERVEEWPAEDADRIKFTLAAYRRAKGES